MPLPTVRYYGRIGDLQTMSGNCCGATPPQASRQWHEERQRHLRPDDRSGLKELFLLGGQAVDARRQHRLYLCFRPACVNLTFAWPTVILI